MGKKREHDSDSGEESKKPRPSSQILGVSRSISACQRCRIKKVKCDQNFPKCSKCAKAKVECIGLDPATGRQIPRSYVIHLEDRIAALELKMRDSGLDPESIPIGDNMPSDLSAVNTNGSSSLHTNNTSPNVKDEDDDDIQDEKEQNVLMNEVSFSTINSSNNRQISTGQGISFAKLMSTAVKFKDRKSNFSNTPDVEVDPTTSTSLKDIQPALLPPKRTAQEFLRIFFAQSNSQLPILHREEFLKNCFLPIYGRLDPDISLASNYTAIHLAQLESDPYFNDDTLTWFYQYKQTFNTKLNHNKQNGLSTDPVSISKEIIAPAKFHKPLYFLNIVFGIASSTHHLQYPSTISDSFRLAAIKFVDQVYSSHDQLESLQGILLSALYSIMRPAVPGCWYLVGSALRLCIDLGLHSESINQNLKVDSFTLDKRRRLFWCTYSVDRQTCFFLTRPVGISDESITTPFPSELDDALIVPHDTDNLDYSNSHSGVSSYKSISISFFKMRQIQSEVQRILFGNCELPRQFNSLNEWKKHTVKLLNAWKNNSPKTRRKMNCDFNLDFFGLNYNHTLLTIHGLSPKNFKLSQQDFSRVSESSKELINIYTQLLNNKSINYTWAAILNLFMAGTSYLYAIYNSEQVRLQNSLFEVKKITQECITVLNSLVDRCDAALNCKNTFEVLTAAVVKLKYNETVHGNTKIKFPTNIKLFKDYTNNNLSNLVENLKSQETDIQENGNTTNGIKPQDVSTHQAQINQNEFETFTNRLENDLNPFNQDQLIAQSLDTPLNPLNLESTPIVSTYLNNVQAGSEFLGFKSPSTFEWTSSNKVYENELDSFFTELEKSPNSTNSRRNSFSDNDFNNQFVNINSNLSQTQTQAQNQTPYSYDSGESSNSSPVLLSNNITPYTDLQNSRRPNQRPIASTIQMQPLAQESPQRGRSDNGVPSKDGRKVFEMIHQVPVDQIWDQFFTNSSNSYFNVGSDA